MRSRLRTACTVALGCVLCPACRPGGAADRTPKRVAGPRDAVAAGVPYPVGEPERVEGWSRAALAQASFAVAWLGDADPDAPDYLPQSAAWPTPIVLGRVLVRASDNVDPVLDRARAAALRDDPPAGVPSPVDADALADADVAAPAPSVFLVGPDRNCRARLQQPSVVRYDVEGREVVEIAWRPIDCPDVDATWAPIAVVTDRFPEDTRWVAAQLVVDLAAPYHEGWTSPLADAVRVPSWNGEAPPQLEVVHVLAIPDVVPTVVQVYDSLLSPTSRAPAPAGDEPETPTPAPDGARDPACDDQFSTEVAHGMWNGTLFDPFDPDPAAELEPHLLGAFVRAGQIDALVYATGFDALVVVPPAPTADGTPTEWVRRRLVAGERDSATLRTWGYLPGAGVVPFGSACD